GGSAGFGANLSRLARRRCLPRRPSAPRFPGIGFLRGGHVLFELVVVSQGGLARDVYRLGQTRAAAARLRGFLRLSLGRPGIRRADDGTRRAYLGYRCPEADL